VQIDWGSADVEDGRLTVPVTGGKPSKQWADTVSRVLDRLQRGERWGEIDVTKKRLRVDSVQPGSEADLRHLLESAVLQANSEFDDEPEPDDERSDADQEMTDAFRAFADDAS
jgi:hypothetical protein